jgi:hypothetical protein
MQYDEQYWNERLSEGTPKRVVAAIKRIYSCYPADCMPQGLCDPMYIMNIIALELGVGDGRGKFDGVPE